MTEDEINKVFSASSFACEVHGPAVTFALVTPSYQLTDSKYLAYDDFNRTINIKSQRRASICKLLL